jgi:hypothetical protein
MNCPKSQAAEQTCLSALGSRRGLHKPQGHPMNNIIYIIGLIVVVLAILAFLGLR